DVRSLVVEENVRAKRAQEFPFVETAEEKRLVDPDVPRAQRADHPLMRGCAAGRHERRADRARIFREISLDPMESGEKFLEWAAAERLVRRIGLALREGCQTIELIDAL